MNKILNNKFEKKRVLRTYLANNGWQEIITYSLISSEMKKEFSAPTGNDFYYLLMPKNDYHQYYRQTLIPSHLKTLKYNLAHGNKDLFFFEISSVYGPSHKEELLILSGIGKFFRQPLHKLVQKMDFYWLKGVLENIFELWQISSFISFIPTSPNYLDYSQSTEIFLGKERIGFLGRVQPLIVQKYQINEVVLVTQISLTKIFNYLSNYPPQFHYRPVSNFPTSTKDLSFTFPESINYSAVIKTIREVADNNLQEVNIFDVYQNIELEKERKKSIGFHLIFQSPTKTLENKEIERILRDIVERVERMFAAKLRD